MARSWYRVTWHKRQRVLTFTGEEHDSNLGRKADISIFRGSLQLFKLDNSCFLLIYYSLIILPFHAVQAQILVTSINKRIYCLGFEVLTPVVLKSSVFYVVRSCRRFKVNRRLRRKYCLILLRWRVNKAKASMKKAANRDFLAVYIMLVDFQRIKQRYTSLRQNSSNILDLGPNDRLPSAPYNTHGWFKFW
jgi:hypothetical protein